MKGPTMPVVFIPLIVAAIIIAIGVGINALAEYATK